MGNLMLMTPANLTFSEMLGNGVRYVVPRFQRDYAWELEQWEDLWQDIETLEEEGLHYMGYIVLQRRGEHAFEVIDGQQRLVTFSLVVLAAMRRIQGFVDAGVEVDDNCARLRVLKERLIGSTNPVSLTVENKLSLNRNNHRYFREICSTMEVLHERGVSRTNALLDGAFSFFVQKINGENGGEVAQLIERISSCMVFTKIVTEDSLNAYKVFETLNARGVQLSTPDLLKNHIFSTLAANEDLSDATLDVLDEAWATIIAQLGESNFTEFVRHHHNCHHRSVSSRTLFRSLKQTVTTPQGANSYLSSLKQHAPIYSALLRPDDEWWRSWGNHRRQIAHYLRCFQLFQVRQPFSVLMAALAQERFHPDEVVKVMRYFHVLAIRYHVICRLSPAAHDQARAMRLRSRSRMGSSPAPAISRTAGSFGHSIQMINHSGMPSSFIECSAVNHRTRSGFC